MHQNTSQESFPPLLNIDDLARLIHKKSTTIAVDRIRRPESLPPDCTPPLQKSPVWMLTAVLEWYTKYQKPAVEHCQDEPDLVDKPKRRRGAPTKAERVAKRKTLSVNGGAN